MPGISRLHVLPLMAAFIIAVAVPAHGRSDGNRQLAVSSITDGLARHIAGSLANPETREQLISAAANRPVDLKAIWWESPLAYVIAGANQAVLHAKGLPATSGSMLRIRLADGDMRTALARGEVPLIAATPSDDTATSLIAYDPSGKMTVLDAARVPQRPVFLVEVDVAKAMPLGLRVIRDRLAGASVSMSRITPTETAGYWATKINAIRLSDDQEPWFKGGAEIYSIVGGFGLDGHPKVNIVQMPYLDHDGTTSYPYQLVVHFSAYKYNLADIVMMEDDGDTNYQQVATAIANALLSIVDGGAYIPLVNAILAAIPVSWWTDDPDYVDSWYTLTTTSSGRLNGASANGWMDVEPYWVAPL